MLLVLTVSFLNAQEEAGTAEKEWEAMIKECEELTAKKRHHEAIEVGKKSAKIAADKYGKENWRVGKSILVMSLAYKRLGTVDPAKKEIAASGFERALAILGKAAEQGNAQAQFELGEMYGAGKGIAVDMALTRALPWIKRRPLNADKGVAVDKAEAVKWWRRAAEQGHAMSQFFFGAMYGKGEGVTQDWALAVKWYRKAADQGLADAQFGLGVEYSKGEGVDRDDVEAVKWYRKAADQGLADAQLLLGFMYAHGRGVAEDDEEGVKWYRKAAEQGHANAKEALKALGVE